MKKLDCVNVYCDPLSVSDLEGKATIMTTPIPEMFGEHHGTDEKGRPLFRCVVKFDGEETGYHRTVSELIDS